MQQVDYRTMSDRELKEYWQANRQDEAALQAHLDRLNQHSRPVIAHVDDPDFDDKLQQEIDRQRNAARTVKP
jgi:hypothetical protein